MRILQVIDILNTGGAERVFVDMCNILNENDQDVSVLFLLDNKGELTGELNVPFINLNRKNKWNIFTMYECSKIISQYDIVHCHLRQVYKYIALVNLIFKSNSKIIFQDHYGSIETDKKIPFLFGTILKPKYYIGVSTTLTQWASDILKIKRENIRLLQNIIKKRKNIVTDKKFDFILVSNIKPVKNNLFALELCKSFNTSLLMVGKNQNDKYYNEVLSQITEQVKIDSSVSDAQVVIPAAHIGLHTSESETGPLVLIEYLAQGIPFLAYETGEVARILKPHFPDYFIDNFDMELWKERVELLKIKQHDTEKMNAIFNKYFGKEDYFYKILDIYAWVVKN